MVARLLGDELSKSLGVPFVVESRPGARGLAASDYVAKSDSSGQTLLIVSSDMSFRPFQRELTPVGMIATGPMILGTGTAERFASVTEFVSRARSRPTSMTTVGLGSALALAKFEAAANVQFKHVPFVGSGAGLTSLLSGETQGGFFPSPGILGLIRDGRVGALATASRERSPLIPDVPTLTEQGFSGATYELWIGMMAPVRSPRDVINRLNEALVSVLRSNEIAARLAMIGVTPSPSSPDGFAGSVNRVAGVPSCGPPCPDECRDGCGDTSCCVVRY
jgi:tripartite-type tricarboxylate transporter receptor subunit TctC